MGAVLSLDQGTTSSRALLFSAEGEVVRVAQQEFQQHYRQPGWVEHDPEELWQSQLSSARAALEGSEDVACVGITNQRETTLVWERDTGRAIHPAVVWQSRQTADLCEGLRERGLEETVRAKTGLVIDAYFSGTKARHILDAVDGAQERAERGELCFGTVDSWLVYKLTGGRVHATEPSNASRTMLYNIHAGDWDDELCAELGVPRAMLPEVLPSSGSFGETDAEVLGRALPITGIAGDQQAALFGQGCHSKGQAKNTYGTGCFLLMNTGTEARTSENGLLTTIAWQLGDEVHYALEGSVFVGGAVIQWLRDELGLIQDAAESEALAASVEDTQGVYIVPAFTGLGAPHWREDVRGLITGLTRGAGRAHIVRAALESIAYQVGDLVECFAEDSGEVISALQVDGGASANDLLMQLQADVLGAPVVRPSNLEVTAFGAALLAGLGAGVWQDAGALRGVIQEDARFEPAMSHERRAELQAGWRAAVEQACASSHLLR